VQRARALNWQACAFASPCSRAFIFRPVITKALCLLGKINIAKKPEKWALAAKWRGYSFPNAGLILIDAMKDLAACAHRATAASGIPV